MLFISKQRIFVECLHLTYPKEYKTHVSSKANNQKSIYSVIHFCQMYSLYRLGATVVLLDEY